MRSLKLKSAIQLALCFVAALFISLAFGVTRVSAEGSAVYPTFIGAEMTVDSFGDTGKATEIDMVDPVTGTTKLFQLNGNAREYKKLLPTADPGYDYYEWRMYNSGAKNSTLRVGGKDKITIENGWNTIVITWEELNLYKNFYIEGKYETLHFGLLTGKKAFGLTFIDKEMKASDFGAAATTETMADPEIGQVKMIKIAGNARSYASLLPAAEPAFDYYEWRMYNAGNDSSIRIGGKSNIPFAKGWNTIVVSWANLNGSTKNFYKTGEDWSNVYVGSLIGKKASGLTFIDKEMKASDFGATATTETIVDPEIGYVNMIKVTDSNRKYESLMPAADPGYNYYEWRMYNAGNADTIRVGGKDGITLAKGWNTIVLSWSNLMANKNIYKKGGYYSQLYIGSLVGVKVNVSTAFGASIRFSDDGGIRFTSEIAVDEYNALKAKYKDVTFGMLTLPATETGSDKLTVDNASALNFVF